MQRYVGFRCRWIAFQIHDMEALEPEKCNTVTSGAAEIVLSLPTYTRSSSPKVRIHRSPSSSCAPTDVTRCIPPIPYTNGKSRAMDSPEVVGQSALYRAGENLVPGPV